MFGGFFSALDLSDIWQYSVEKKWERLETSAVWGSRSAFGAIHDSKNRLIIAGGRSSTGFRADMWFSTGDLKSYDTPSSLAIKIALILGSVAAGLFVVFLFVHYARRIYKYHRRKHLYKWMREQVEDVDEEEDENAELQIFPRSNKGSKEEDDLILCEIEGSDNDNNELS